MQQINKSNITRSKNRAIRHALAQESAEKSLGKLEKGFSVFCLNKGQYSVINVIEALLKVTGRADVIISTWTAANAEIQKAENFLDNGNINRLHWVVDRSFKTRQKKYFDLLVSRFGEQSISETNSHAKFTLISNDDWKVVLRTSMNLNENKRLEFFEVSDDPDLFEYVHMILDDVIVGGDFDYRKFDALGSGDKYNAYKDTNILDDILDG